MTGLTVVLTGVHFQLARLTGVQEFAKPEAEIKTLLVAWQNYLRHCSIGATQKTVDLVTALSVTTFMYVPVAAGVVQKRRQRRAGQRPAPRPPAQVFQFRPNPQAAQPNGQTPPPPSPPPSEFSPDMTYEPELMPAE